MPRNTFVGLEEVLPGIEGDKIPNPRTAGKLLSVNLLPRADLYIHNINMITSTAFESRFENFLRRMKQEKYRGADNARGNLNNVVIDERKIIVSVNNTWRNVVEDAYTSMSSPNQQGVSTSGGSLTIKNFICHPMVALIFRVEYKATIPMPNGNEQMFFTIGWTLHLPAFNAAGELSNEQLETNFTMGPGTTPNGDLLWDANAEDTKYYQVKIKAWISVNSSPPPANAASGPGMGEFFKATNA